MACIGYLTNLNQKGGESVSINIDMSILWDQVNTWFPVMFGVFAVAGGLGVAIKLAMFIIDEVKRAF